MRKLVERDVTLDRCGACGGTWFDDTELARLADDERVEAAASRVVTVASPSRFGCPRCWGDCVEARVGGITTDTCTSCRGVWLDLGELEAARREVAALRRMEARLTPVQRLVLRLAAAVGL